jgi:hypothetical protein
MRYLLILILSLMSSLVFARDGYDTDYETLLSPENVESRALVHQIELALVRGQSEFLMGALLSEPSLPIEGKDEAAKKAEIAKRNENMAGLPVPLEEAFAELERRTQIQSRWRYVDGIANRLRQLPARNTYLSRRIIEIIKKSPNDSALVFSKNEKENLKIAAAAIDFIAFTSLEKGVSDVFRGEVAEFILRSRAHFSIRSLLLQWMLSDMSSDLYHKKSVHRETVKWLNRVATEFGQLEYLHIEKEEQRKVLNIHQQMIGFAHSKGIKLCDRFLEPLALSTF